jgi:hypothetical protein
VELSGNKATGSASLDGVGGAIALDERCTNAGCPAITARLVGLNLTGNAAQLAGGALFYSGSSRDSSLVLK